MEEKQQWERVIGLTLQLQKFGVGKARDESDLRANTILGHYDHLVIRRITNWLEYSPRMDWKGVEPPGDICSADLLATHYPIKLLFPDKREVDGLPEFEYERWKDYETQLEDNPCMTAVLLNLTDVYKDQVTGSLLGAFLRLLRDCCEPALLSEVHCCVLPSLGYSDFCILMAGRDWKPALRLVELLHSLTVPAAEGDKQIPVLSTDYMMPVCHPRAGATLEEKFANDYFKGIELTVRVNLCPGVTAQQLADWLKNVQVYRISGGSDCLLWAKDQQAQELMDALMGDRERNLVIDMASTPQLRVEPAEQAEPAPAPTMTREELIRDADSFREEIDRFKDVIRRYGAELERHRRHIRQASVLWELAAIIESLCVQPHAGSLRELMKDLIHSFSTCLGQCAREMKKPDWDFGEMEDHVSEFSGIVGRFLEDLSRSDCFFMEREKYNHASVSSATSLLIVYNQWLNEFTNAVREATQEKNRSHYSFLVTCGGRDQTRTASDFYFLTPQVEGTEQDQLYEELPLVTQMSEMSLFDFSGTILRSFHECMHYTGERKRRERIEFFLAFVISQLSYRMAEQLMDGGGFIQAQSALKELGVFDAVEEEMGRIYAETLRELSNGIAGLLEVYFPESERKSWNERDYLSMNVQNWAYRKLFIALSGHELTAVDGAPSLIPNPLAAGLYDKTMEAQKTYFQRCGELCRRHGVSTVVFDYGAQQLEALQEADRTSSRRTNETLSTQVQMVLSRLLISEAPDVMEIPEEYDTPAYYEWNREFPYIMLTCSNIYSILLGATDIFSESFADVAACTILNVSLEDYLLMHVYEEWDLDGGRVMNMCAACRIPAVLRLCFRGSLENNVRLNDKTREKIEAAIKRLEGHGMPAGRLNAETLCGQVDRHLAAFAAMENEGAPLLKYLSMCQGVYQDPQVREKMDKFSTSFQKIRLLAVDPEGEDLPKRLVEMHRALCGGWRGDNGGRSHQVR